MNRRRILIWAIVVGSIFLLLFFVAAWMFGETLVAPAHRTVADPIGLPFEAIEIPSDSGSTLAAWFIPVGSNVAKQSNTNATVILLHPIRSDRRSMFGRAKLLHEKGFSTLLVDLQAHGESAGEQITAGYQESHDVRAAVGYIHDRFPEQKIGIVGRSLGGAATLLATPLEIDALVLESVYPTITEAVHNRVAMRLGPLHHLLAPVLLAQLKPRLGISPSQLRPIDHIANVGCPILIASGELDQHTTLAETEQLFAAAVQPKQLSIFEDAAHVDLLKRNPAHYNEQVIRFLQEHLQKP